MRDHTRAPFAARGERPRRGRTTVACLIGVAAWFAVAFLSTSAANAGADTAGRKRPPTTTTTTTVAPTADTPPFEPGATAQWCADGVVCEATAVADHERGVLSVDLDVTGAGSETCFYLMWCAHHYPFTVGGTAQAWFHTTERITQSVRSLTSTVDVAIDDASISGTPPPACVPIYGWAFAVSCGGFTLEAVAQYCWVDGDTSGCDAGHAYVFPDQATTGTTQTLTLRVGPFVPQLPAGTLTVTTYLRAVAGSELGAVHANSSARVLRVSTSRS